MLHLHFVLLLLLSTVIGPEPEVTQHYRKGLVCEDISTKIENRENACAIERELKNEGFDSPLIEAALLNAYAESKFDNWAVGDGGKSKGIFQLHRSGLGNKMTDEQRHDIKSSVRRVSVAIRKSPKLQRAINNGAETSELTRLFCTEIMRPKNRAVKARERAKLENELFESPAAKRRQLRRVAGNDQV
jgi:hypothetical protein